MTSSLFRWGYGPFESTFSPFAAQGLVPGRVLTESREIYTVAVADGERTAEPTGRLRFAAGSREELPAVGDWVALLDFPSDGQAYVQAVLPRRTRLARKAAGTAAEVQLIGANVDTLLIVSALEGDLSTRRLERYVALAREGGVEPAIVLTKADLVPDAPEACGRVAAAFPGVPVHAVSARSGTGLDALTALVAPGRTVALAGSSGVGKSTLVNLWLGREEQETRDVRASDGRGRHATTRRELFLLPSGAVVLDTPGMRELALWGEAPLPDEIAKLAESCRFRDCAHGAEPGCAVRAAASRGELDPARLEGLEKLRREEAWLAMRREMTPAAAEKKRWKTLMKSAVRPLD